MINKLVYRTAILADMKEIEMLLKENKLPHRDLQESEVKPGSCIRIKEIR